MLSEEAAINLFEKVELEYTPGAFKATTLGLSLRIDPKRAPGTRAFFGLGPEDCLPGV